MLKVEFTLPVDIVVLLNLEIEHNLESKISKERQIFTTNNKKIG